MTRAQCDQRLDDLIPRVARIGPGVQEREQPGPPISLGHDQTEPDEPRPQCGCDQHSGAHAGDEHHQEHGTTHDQDGAEIPLEHDEERHGPGDEPERHQPQNRLIEMTKVGGQDGRSGHDDDELGQLGGLHAERTHLDPS